MLLEKCIDEFKKNLFLKERSKETIRGYTMLLHDFRRFMEMLFNGYVYIDEIDLNNLESYLFYRKEKGDQPVSRNRAIYIFRSFYDFLIKRDFVNVNISQKLETIKVQKKERIYLSLEEIKELINGVDHQVIKVAITTLAYTGLRVSELCNLTVDNVDLDNELILVIGGKGNKNRTIPISKNLINILIDYSDNLRPNTYSDFFFATDKSGSLSPYYINFHLKATIKKLGWKKHVTAHILRHSFASALVKNNASLPALQSLLGHSDLRVTSIYIHQNIDQLKDAVNLI